MEKPETNGHSEHIPEYFIDVNSGQLLLGKIAVGVHIDSGGHPSDVCALREILLDDSRPTPENSNLETPGKLWSNEDIITAGQWICNVVGFRDRSRQMLINEKIINRAYQLGIMASPGRIKSRRGFGTLSNFYAELDSNRTQRKFPELTPLAAKEYIVDLSHKLGHFPTRHEIDELAKENTTFPSYEALWARLPKGGLRKLNQELGYELTINLSNGELVFQGLNFMLINEGYMASQKDMDLLSQENMSASAVTIARRFGRKFSNYQSILKSAYENWIDIRDNKLKTIPKEIASGTIPPSLFVDSGDDNVKLMRLARHQLMTRVLSEDYCEEILHACTDDSTDFDFFNLIQEHQKNLDIADIEQILMDLDFAKDMWRNVTPKLDFTRIIQNKLIKERGPLDVEQLENMDYAINVGIDFTLMNNQLPKNAHIQLLRQRRLLPTIQEFERIFIDNDTYRIFVKVKHHSVQKELKSLKNQISEEMMNALNENHKLQNLFINFKIYGKHKDYQKANEKAANYIRSNVDEDRNYEPNFNRQFKISAEEISKNEKIRRYARFKLVEYFLPDLGLAEKLILCSLSRSRTLVQELVNKDLSLTAGEIESTAKMLGLFHYVFPPKEDYLRKLLINPNARGKRKINRDKNKLIMRLTG